MAHDSHPSCNETHYWGVEALGSVSFWFGLVLWTDEPPSEIFS